LFDLTRDPAESRDLAEQEAARLEVLRSEAGAVAEAMRALASGSEAELSEAARDVLRGLGYGRSKGPRD
ncbi:MAG: hypothetical protein AAFP86_05885, partial [Planctomycetota bacterium]